MSGEFLLEIGTEEIPAGFIPPALDAMREMCAKALLQARLDFGSIKTYGGPRRLILVVEGLAPLQTSTVIERTGPSEAQAFDAEGRPTKAALGFAKSQGVDVSELVILDTPKGRQVAVRKAEEGRPAAQALADFLPSLLERIPFPKTMRWMDLDARFARPVHWITALYNGEIVRFSFAAVDSSNVSFGHRFVSPGPFEVVSFADLQTKLEAAGVIVDQDRRRASIAKRIDELAEEDGLAVFEDQALLDEVTYLVESPFPVKGEFSPDFLELPASILITCMKKHQRYFSLHNAEGRIVHKFVAINNTPVKDEAVSIKGHQRVLKARLEDARFYFREDRKEPLIDRLEALKGVVFHSKLGTAYEKIERFTNLALSLADQWAPAKRGLVERASLLCKCDLETGIVYEFPELQGIIGSYYAGMDGEDQEVAAAVREHYLPVSAGDRLPEGIVGAIVSIADRVDTIVGCFGVGLLPTGASDPYALRRNALGILQILINFGRPLDLPWLIGEAIKNLGSKLTRSPADTAADALDFIRTRFVHFHTGRDFPLDVVEAVVRARFDDAADARRRVEALNVWKDRPDFDAVIMGIKRVINILKDATPGAVDESVFVEPAESALHATFREVVSRAEPLIAEGNYIGALEIIADLKAPIDTFFDKVMVMVEDEKIRTNRLALLAEIGRFFTRIADFSVIGSTASK